MLSTRTQIIFSNKLIMETGIHFNQNLNRPLTFTEFIEQNMPTDKATVDYSLAGISGKKLIYKTGAGLIEVLIAIPHPNIDQNITTIIYKIFPGNTKTPKIIDQILSTFKFLD